MFVVFLTDRSLAVCYETFVLILEQIALWDSKCYKKLAKALLKGEKSIQQSKELPIQRCIQNPVNHLR